MCDSAQPGEGEPLFSPLVEHAIELSSQWHDRTYRKGRWRDPAFPLPTEEILRVPVMAHVTAVASIVQRAGWDLETVSAAFLHDVIEDGNRYGDRFRYEELETLLGERVAQLVLEVTEPKYDEEGRPLPWRERKQAYLHGLERASDEAIAISLADKIHNLWSINESIVQGIDVFEPAAGRRPLGADSEQQRWFYASVLERSRGRSDDRLPRMRRQLEAELKRFDQVLTRS